MDAGSATDERASCGRRSRVVLAPLCRRQVRDDAQSVARMTGSTKQLVPGESAEEAAKPLRGECRMFSGASAVKTGVHTFHQHYAHTRLRVHWAPGIPRALCSRGLMMSGKARARGAARSPPRMRGMAACIRSWRSNDAPNVSAIARAQSWRTANEQPRLEIQLTEMTRNS